MAPSLRGATPFCVARKQSSPSPTQPCRALAYCAHMSVLSSKIDKASSDFAKNLARMNELEEELSAALSAARAGGGESAQKRQREQGKLPVRERIDLLLDEGSAFLETGALAANG